MLFTDELEQVEVERYSRRKSSQAATAKISEFARQLLHASARCYGLSLMSLLLIFSFILISLIVYVTTDSGALY